jgi:hypothetical protein
MRSREEVLREFELPPCNCPEGEVHPFCNQMHDMADRIAALEAEVARVRDYAMRMDALAEQRRIDWQNAQSTADALFANQDALRQRAEAAERAFEKLNDAGTIHRVWLDMLSDYDFSEMPWMLRFVQNLTEAVMPPEVDASTLPKFDPSEISFSVEPTNPTQEPTHDR